MFFTTYGIAKEIQCVLTNLGWEVGGKPVNMGVKDLFDEKSEEYPSFEGTHQRYNNDDE